MPSAPGGDAVRLTDFRDRTQNRGEVGSRQFRILLLAGLAAAGPTRLARAEPVPGVTDTVHVREHPLTLEEIIARCVQGEKSKLGGHSDMTCTVAIRLLAIWEKKKEIHDVAVRKYSDITGFARLVQLGEKRQRFKLEGGQWVLQPEKDENRMRVEVDDTGGLKDFTEIPFFLEDQQEYDFTLLGRTVEGDHVIFKIGFRPRSNFKPLPSGTVYVDTDHYRIVHEEFTFAKNPFPLFLKKVNKISRHWEELPGGEWVFTRILMEAEPREYFGALPERIEIAVTRHDFQFDHGYDTHVFGKR